MEIVGVKAGVGPAERTGKSVLKLEIKRDVYNNFTLTFDYCYDFIYELKRAIPPTARSYNEDTKIWTVKRPAQSRRDGGLFYLNKVILIAKKHFDSVIYEYTDGKDFVVENLITGEKSVTESLF